MDREAAPSVDDDQEVTPAARGRQQDPDGDGVVTRTPGGKDALGTKENLLAPWYDEMVEVCTAMAAKFTPLGLSFRPQVLLATAMQEAAPKDPLNARSFDNGLGIMQITPYQGKLDPGVAKAIGWDNSKGVEYNIQHSRWRDAKANLVAGAETMLVKAKAIQAGVPKIWAEMDEPHKWRAVLFAYNAGQGSAISALKRGGPNAAMISTYTDPKGRRVSHDYTAEIKAKMDYVDSHDPFAGAGATTSDKDQDDEEDKPPTSTEPKGTGNLKQSVGRGGVNDADDVQAVQTRLKERGVDPGTIDSLIGPKTIGAIERFQSTFLEDPDGNITPRKNTEKKLFGESGKVTIVDKKPTNDRQPDARNEGTAEEEGREGRQEEVDNPSYAEIAKNFKNTIPGSSFTWSDALWLPRWGRHAKPSDVTNTDMATIISNIQRQAAALQKVESHLGKSISVTSWLRPPAYNRLIGGASNSSHMRGLATDFNVSGMSAEQVRRVIKSTPGLYPGAGENQVSWVHLDLEHTSWFNP